MAPAAFTGWIADLFPASIHPVSEFLGGVIVMPLLYWGLYEALRRMGAKSQSFIYLLVLLFLIMTVTQIRTGAIAGGWQHWLSGLMMLAYASGFAWIAWRGYKANQNDVDAVYHAEKEEQINIHAQAILRAKEIEQRQAGGV
jgi:Ca2+/Na+ antiporter